MASLPLCRRSVRAKRFSSPHQEVAPNLRVKEVAVGERHTKRMCDLISSARFGRYLIEMPGVGR